MASSKDEQETTPRRTGFTLSRYPGQRILIEGGIVVHVNEVRGNRVYIYVETPQGIRVERPPKDEDKLDRLNWECS